MKVNVDRCWAIHSGKKKRYEYRIIGKVLSEVQKEKGLRVIISNDLKVSQQSTDAAQRQSVRIHCKELSL